MSDPDHNDEAFWRAMNAPLDSPPEWNRLHEIPNWRPDQQWRDCPDWVFAEAERENARRDRIAAMPRVRFLWFEPGWENFMGRSTGFVWDKKPSAGEGEYIYRRVFLIHTTFRIWLEKC